MPSQPRSPTGFVRCEFKHKKPWSSREPRLAQEVLQRLGKRSQSDSSCVHPMFLEDDYLYLVVLSTSTGLVPGKREIFSATLLLFGPRNGKLSSQSLSKFPERTPRLDLAA